MQAIVDILSAFGQAIGTLFDIIFGFFEDIVYIIKITGIFIVRIPDYFSWLPSEVVALIVVIFGIVVVYKILGREG